MSTPVRCAAALTAAILGSMAAGQGPGGGVYKASTDSTGGMPRLMLDGQCAPPLTFFFNTQIHENYVERFQTPQVKLAADAGIHIYSYLARMGAHTPGGVDYSEGDAVLASFVETDPKALFVLRLWPGPHPGWPEWKDIDPGEMGRSTEGLTGKISRASGWFWGPSNEDLTDYIRHIEEGPYGDRVIGYHIGGPEFEMFPYLFRQKGPDISEANTRRFRAWLRDRYGSDAALAEAWGKPGLTLEAAQVPRDPDRFPMRSVGSSAPIAMFYRLPEERDWVDYGAYVSELAAERIADWAALVKRVTQGRKLTVFCYGYLFELVGSFGAHNDTHRVLQDPNVDCLMSPVPYMGRDAGEPAGFMTTIDTVAAHGKLWINEDDIRTHLITEENTPDWLHDDMFGRRATSLEETLGLLERNLGALLTHRAGMWWMDLAGGGAFNQKALWDMLETRKPLFQELCVTPQPFRPEVAVLVDESSKLYVKSDWDGFYWSLPRLRNAAAQSGARVGYYTLRDFIDGVAPPCAAYVFANAFALEPAEAQAIRSRLTREGAMGVFMYAPGLIRGDALDAEQTSRVTGMRLRVGEGMQRTVGAGLLDGLAWGPELTLDPLLRVDDGEAEALGRYAANGAIAAAMKDADGFTSVFLGALGPSHNVLTRLFKKAGAHIWTEGGHTVRTDGRVLILHAAREGAAQLNVPEGRRLEPLYEDHAAITGAGAVDMKRGETRWFRIEPPLVREEKS